MRSLVQLKGHPVHVMLIPFPLAFFCGSFIFDLAGWIRHNEALTTSAYHLQVAGILFGVVTAIPGIMDYIFTVPPHSSGKKRAAQHGILNSCAVLLFALSVYLRRQDLISVYLQLVIDLVGVVLLSIAGWMGGTLTHRNQIGIDHRYANAGKWNEEYFPEGTDPIEVAKSEELTLNQMKLLHIGPKRIVLARTEDEFVAFDDHCTHRGGSLADGTMIACTVQCPWHGSQFDARTGKVKAGPAKEDIRTYGVKEKDGKVYLQVK